MNHASKNDGEGCRSIWGGIEAHFRFRRLIPVAVTLLLLFSTPGMASALLEEEKNTIAVVDKVAPSVVNIVTKACEPGYYFCAVPETEGTGSGVVLKEDGLIVTNHHVVSDALDIEVVLADGRRLKGDLVGSSPYDDIAVVRVRVGDRPLKAIELGDSDAIQVGEKVLAVGNPFGLGQTLTVGIVSMTGRDVRKDGIVLKNLIQTDAAINPGNSGGALVNSSGQLIGMNTIILSPTGTSVGIGFAIPVNKIRAVAPGLVYPVSRWLTWAFVVLLVIWVYRRIRRTV